MRGYDAGKRIKGRKRHILVDTLGMVLKVVVHPADVQDRDGAKLVLQKLPQVADNLEVIWADGGYAGKLVNWVGDLREDKKLRLDIVKRSDDLHSFKVLPWRWVVERTFGWLSTNRRLVRDYETLVSSSEAFVYVAMIRLISARFAA